MYKTHAGRYLMRWQFLQFCRLYLKFELSFFRVAQVSNLISRFDSNHLRFSRFSASFDVQNFKL